jgi:hypothetical protein
VGKKTNMPPGLLRLFADVYAFDTQLSVRRPDERRGDFEEGCLSGAVPAEQCQEFATSDAQRDSG